MEISNKEVLRYLGYCGAEADERLYALIKEISIVFAENTVPKSVYGIWDCRVDSSTVELADLVINSGKLAKHLAGCPRVALLAVTLGPEADTLIRRFSVQDMEKALIAQAVGTVLIEAYCGKIENEIEQKNELSGLNRTMRFSPGYGDFDISHQKDIIDLLNCDRKIGLTLTSGYMLAPSKSLTAVIGFAEEKVQTGGKCECNAAKPCEFRGI